MMAFYMTMRSTKLSVQVAVKVFTSQVQQNKICNQNKAFEESKIWDGTSSNTDWAWVVFQSICHYTFEKNIEKSRWEQATLADPNNLLWCPGRVPHYFLWCIAASWLQSVSVPCSELAPVPASIACVSTLSSARNGWTQSVQSADWHLFEPIGSVIRGGRGHWTSAIEPVLSHVVLIHGCQ